MYIGRYIFIVSISNTTQAGYQITQQRQPIARGGFVSYVDPDSQKEEEYVEKIARITQIQLEQDSGKSLHDEALQESLIDLNRAGKKVLKLIFG